MATATQSSEGLRKLEKELTCPVCLDLYTNPKILPCHHSFCQECLEGLPQEREARGNTYYILCPTCRQRTEVPKEGVGAFPVAFTLNNLKEITQSLKKNASDPQKITCNDHDKPLDMFCEKCETVICRNCTYHTHKNHKHALVSDCYPKHYQMLQDSLKPINGKKKTLKKVLSDLGEREGEIRERGEGVLEEIHGMVEEMIGILRQSERKLTEQAKSVTDAKLQKLSEQTKSAQANLSLLEDVEDYVKQSLKTGTHQQVLSSKKQMMKQIHNVTRYAVINVKELLHLMDEAKLKLIKDRKIMQSLHHIGTIANTVPQPRIATNRKVEYLPQGIVSFPLSIATADSSLVSIPPSSLKCNLVPVIRTSTAVTSTHPGVYRIHCNPSARGTHTVKVQVEGIQLEDKFVSVPFNPYHDKIAPVRIVKNINGPRRVAVSDDGHVIVIQKGDDCVIKLDSKGKKVKSLGIERKGYIFSAPRGVAITPDNFILVSDNHRIVKISMDGDCKKSVGGKGSGRQQFNTPTGIAISPITGQVYIADRLNHRIQVLNPDLTFSHSFGKKGSANGQFNYPTDVAIDSQGLVYVADYNSHRIQKLSPNGRFIAIFGSKGSKLIYPDGITIDNSTGLVYVSERGHHRVSVFTCNGRFVNSFGQFSLPIGMAFDKEGYLYVCDNIRNQITIY